MIDERGRELEAEVAADPKNIAKVHAFALHLVRLGDFLAAQRVVARAIAAGARGKEMIPPLLGANVPMRVVPHRAAHALAGVVGKSALQFADLPSPSATRMALSEGILAGLVADARQVEVRSIPGGLAQIPGSPFKLPGEMVGQCLLVAGNALYVGGADASERARLVAVRDLQEPGSSWRRIDLPEEACPAGKSIHALLPASRTRVIAIDDGKKPGWIHVLDVRAPLAPRVPSSEPLRAHGEGERVLAASLDGRWLALLSADAASRFIALHESDAFAERGLVSERVEHPDDGWQDLLVMGERLVVAAGRRGVLTLALTLLPDPSLVAEALAPVPDLKLEPNEAVTRLTRLDATRCVASVATVGRIQRHVVVRFG